MAAYKQKLMVVEDDHALRQVLTDRLIEEGFDVISAENGEVGLALAEENHPIIILLDIFMPKMDGITMLTKLRRESEWGKSVYVMVITNTVDASTVATIAGFGNTEFLIKSDWGLEDIVRRIKELLK